MFDFNGGYSEGIYYVEIEENHTISHFPDVRMTGHTLDGWFLLDGHTKIDTYTHIISDLTCIAHWKANNYYVEFDAAGGEGGWSSMLEYGSALVPPEVTREGYDFIGWNPPAENTVPEGGRIYTA